MRELIFAGGSSGGSSMMRLKRSVRDPAVLERERVPRRARGFMLLGEPAPEREGCDCDTLVDVSKSLEGRSKVSQHIRWPFSLDLQEHFPAAIVVGELCFEKACEIRNAVRLGLFDVEHPPVHVLAGLIVLGLLAAQFLLCPEIFPLALL